MTRVKWYVVIRNNINNDAQKSSRAKNKQTTSVYDEYNTNNRNDDGEMDRYGVRFCSVTYTHAHTRER